MRRREVVPELQALGADAVVVTTEEDVVARIKEITGGWLHKCNVKQHIRTYAHTHTRIVAGQQALTRSAAMRACALQVAQAPTLLWMLWGGTALARWCQPLETAVQCLCTACWRAYRPQFPSQTFLPGSACSPAAAPTAGILVWLFYMCICLVDTLQVPKLKQEANAACFFAFSAGMCACMASGSTAGWDRWALVQQRWPPRCSI